MSLRIDRIFNAKSRKVIKELKKKWNKTTDIDDEVFLVIGIVVLKINLKRLPFYYL